MCLPSLQCYQFNTCTVSRSHIGIGGCLRRAQELLYWPRINAEVKDYVSKCSVCQSYQPDQCREELQPHEMPSRPWSKVAADIFELGPQQFLIMVDYWSSYFEVQELKQITSISVIHALKVQFARHGIPEVLVTDNGTQFSSSEFAKFAETWRFEHKTSSPRYPQSNGKAENAVKVCKALLKKARADNKDPLLAFLDWRNTPSEGLGTSPVQRLMGRRTLLPTHTRLLEPKVDSQTGDKLAKRKAIQEQRYNKKSQPIAPLQPGRAIRMKLPGDTKWSLGSCVKILPNRSYEVEVAGRRYRRNRRQLRTTAETPPSTLATRSSAQSSTDYKASQRKPRRRIGYRSRPACNRTCNRDFSASCPTTEVLPYQENTSLA